MNGWEIHIFTGVTHIFVFTLFITPLYGVVGAPLGILIYQTAEDQFGQRQLVSLNLLAYRNKLTKTYLFLIFGLLLSVIANAIGLQENVIYSHALVSLVCMTVFANLAGKRLESIGWAKTYALLSMVPVFGHIFLVWLAYKPLKTRR